MEMNVNVMKIVGEVVNNPHPKDLSKSSAVAGFFVCGFRSASQPGGCVGLNYFYLIV